MTGAASTEPPRTREGHPRVVHGGQSVLPSGKDDRAGPSCLSSGSGRRVPLSSNKDLVNSVRDMTDEDYLAWRDSQNVSWSDVSEQDLPLLCRTCRMFKLPRLSCGSTRHDHVVSARHIESIERAGNEYSDFHFPAFYVPVYTREAGGDGFRLLHATRRKQKLGKENEKAAIERMLRYLGTGSNTSFVDWCRRSLSKEELDTKRKEGIARELTLELANLIHWGEEDTRDYSVQETASGEKFLREYELGVEFNVV